MCQICIECVTGIVSPDPYNEILSVVIIRLISQREHQAEGAGWCQISVESRAQTKTPVSSHYIQSQAHLVSNLEVATSYVILD